MFGTNQVSMYLFAALYFIVLGVVAYISLTYFFKKKYNFKKPAIQKTPKQRGSDTRVLNKFEKITYQEALNLIQSGNIKEASKLLDSIGMSREAINLLESNGLYDAAANILLRMRLPNRAAALYARGARWAEAEKYYVQAEMYEDAARCAANSGNYSSAAEYYIMLKDIEKAAAAYVNAQQFREAASCYAKLGNESKAIQMYETMVESAEDLTDVKLEDHEIVLLEQFLASGESGSLSLADLLAKEGRLIYPILKLAEAGRIEDALKIYLRTSSNIGEELLASINYNNDSAKNLAVILAKASNFMHSAMIYERLMDFENAAINFEKAREYDRAVYCYDRYGNDDKAREIRAKMMGVSNSGINVSAGFPNDTYQMNSNIEALDDNLKVESSDLPQYENSSDTEFLSNYAPEGSEQINVEHVDDASENILEESENNPDMELYYANEMLNGLSLLEKKLLWQNSVKIEFHEGDEFIKCGEKASGVFLILSGKVNCLSPENDQVIGEYSQNQSFGGHWVLSSSLPDLGFVAKAEGVLYLIPEETLIPILDKNGALARKLYSNISNDLIQNVLTHQKYSVNF